jgi:hypothetical protein
MKRTLTPEQVKKLFAWCEKYEVYDYDLQLEIVDHLASAIEHQWKENPELSFGWALKNIRDKFGWRDFRKLERKMQRLYTILKTPQNYNHILFSHYFFHPITASGKQQHFNNFVLHSNFSCLCLFFVCFVPKKN